MAELILGHKCGVRAPAEHENVQPACVIGDEQSVAPDLSPFDLRSNAEDPRRGSEEAAGPTGSRQDELGCDVNWRHDKE
jgi:hypothetical protein